MKKIALVATLLEFKPLFTCLVTYLVTSMIAFIMFIGMVKLISSYFASHINFIINIMGITVVVMDIMAIGDIVKIIKKIIIMAIGIESYLIMLVVKRKAMMGFKAFAIIIVVISYTMKKFNRPIYLLKIKINTIEFVGYF